MARGNDVTAAGVFADLLRTPSAGSWSLSMVRVMRLASSANMSVRFDVLVRGGNSGGSVRCWAMWCPLRAADQLQPEQPGRLASKAADQSRAENIVYQCWERFCQELGKTVPVAMTLEKSCRLAPELGSSTPVPSWRR